MGIPPRAAATTVRAVIDRWATGRLGAGEFDEPVARARDGFARLCGFAPEHVAIGASVSGQLGLVAASLPPSARVLVRAGEFTSVSYPFAAQADRGVRVTEAAPERFLAEIPDHDLVAVSLVQSADGTVLDAEELRAAAEAGRTRVVLDVTQAAGWLPLEVAWADYVVCAGYKWLLCPRGAAWLAVADPDTLRPTHANFYAAEDPWQGLYGLPMRLAPDARRLDASPVWLAQVGAAAVLGWLAELDMTQVAAHDIALADQLRAGLGLPSAPSPIVAVELGERGERLSAAGIRAAQRAGRTRFAFHLYNTTEDVEAALDALGTG